MLGGVFGKHLGLEEFFESLPTAKRSRCFYKSPISCPDFGFASDNKFSKLLRMFPSINREFYSATTKLFGVSRGKFWAWSTGDKEHDSWLLFMAPK